MRDPCATVSGFLDRYFDQEVTDEERSLVEEHVKECRTCRRALDTLESMRRLIRAPVDEAVEREPFPWVWEKIERGIQAREKAGLWERLRSWMDPSLLLRKRVWIPAAVGAAVVLLITGQFLFRKPSSYPGLSVVEYVESPTHNVMVYELEDARVTVIWLFEEKEGKPAT